jgi:hypothetical protein
MLVGAESDPRAVCHDCLVAKCLPCELDGSLHHRLDGVVDAGLVVKSGGQLLHRRRGAGQGDVIRTY